MTWSRISAHEDNIRFWHAPLYRSKSWGNDNASRKELRLGMPWSRFPAIVPPPSNGTDNLSRAMGPHVTSSSCVSIVKLNFNDTPSDVPVSKVVISVDIGEQHLPLLAISYVHNGARNRRRIQWYSAQPSVVHIYRIHPTPDYNIWAPRSWASRWICVPVANAHAHWWFRLSSPGFA